MAFALALAAPFVLWGNPYPPEVSRYWLWGSGLVIVAVALVQSPLLARLRSVIPRAAAAAENVAPWKFAIIVAAATGSLSILLAIYAFHRGPSTSDELAMLWHARILLHGRLSLPVDPNREFFSLDTVVDTGRWYSQFPIGGPLFLAAGAFVGAPWIVNPVLIAASAVALYHFARRAFGEAQARLAAVLFALAPMVLIMSGTWMNHVPVLFLTTCALAALTEWERATAVGRRAAFAGIIGVCLGLSATIRPLDSVVVSIVIGAFQLAVISHQRGRLHELALQAVCGAIGVAPLLYANWATTGHALTFGYDVSWGAGHRVGFHTDPYGNAHTLAHAADLALTYLGELNMYLMAWPVPALIVLLVGFIAMRGTTRHDRLLIGMIAVQLAAYASYWGEGEFLGPRFLYTALPAIVVLLARTPSIVADRFGATARQMAGTLFVCCCIAAWCIPLSTYSAWGLVQQVRGLRSLLKVDVAGAVRRANIHHAVVFVREPFGDRLARRLWGIGMLRSDAAQLIASRDACSLLSAVRGAERDPLMSGRDKVAAVTRDAAVFTPGPMAVRAADRAIHINSPDSMTPECRRELEVDTEPGEATFGPALPLEPIDSAGRIDGDVIYVADLLDRNEVLRPRFGDRGWYRLDLAREPNGRLVARIAPY